VISNEGDLSVGVKETGTRPNSSPSVATGFIAVFVHGHRPPVLKDLYGQWWSPATEGVIDEQQTEVFSAGAFETHRPSLE
jgi:hypothetical protein